MIYRADGIERQHVRIHVAEIVLHIFRLGRTQTLVVLDRPSATTFTAFLPLLIFGYREERLDLPTFGSLDDRCNKLDKEIGNLK